MLVRVQAAPSLRGETQARPNFVQRYTSDILVLKLILVLVFILFIFYSPCNFTIQRRSRARQGDTNRRNGTIS